MHTAINVSGSEIVREALFGAESNKGFRQFLNRLPLVCDAVELAQSRQNESKGMRMGQLSGVGQCLAAPGSCLVWIPERKEGRRQKCQGHGPMVDRV